MTGAYSAAAGVWLQSGGRHFLVASSIVVPPTMDLFANSYGHGKAPVRHLAQFTTIFGRFQSRQSISF
jgi:hypothetical protein